MIILIWVKDLMLKGNMTRSVISTKSVLVSQWDPHVYEHVVKVNDLDNKLPVAAEVREACSEKHESPEPCPCCREPSHL